MTLSAVLRAIGIADYIDDHIVVSREGHVRQPMVGEPNAEAAYTEFVSAFSPRGNNRLIGMLV